MQTGKGLRERIVDAATAILHTEGAKKLTQPRVARALGIRQSHLTYYFPRRTDLMTAMASRFLETASQKLGPLSAAHEPTEPRSVVNTVHRLIANPDNMRSFLGLIIEADHDPDLRAMLGQHLEEMNGLVAERLGRRRDDPVVGLLLSAFRGMALENLLLGRRSTAEEGEAMGKQLGLIPLDSAEAAPPQIDSRKSRKRRRKQ